jgi:hypothetical protein
MKPVLLVLGAFLLMWGQNISTLSIVNEDYSRNFRLLLQLVGLSIITGAIFMVGYA